nr:MAG TPA: hypothetical protein [Caudoviricetes sp.]
MGDKTRNGELMSGDWWYRGRRNHIHLLTHQNEKRFRTMTDYADAGYRLQRYKITFYADNNGKIPLKVVRRAFASYDCAKMWEANMMHRTPEYNSVTIEME